MKIKDDFKKIPGFDYSINSQGVCRNDASHVYLTPHVATSNYRAFEYNVRKDGKAKSIRVKRLMTDLHGKSKGFEKGWYNKILPMIGGPKQDWYKVPGYNFEMTRGCRVRIIGQKKTYSPRRGLSKAYFEYAIYYEGEKHRFAVNTLFEPTFGESAPEKYTKRYEIKPKEKPGPKIVPTVIAHCPYAENKIQPLYGPMDARFSPLDWYHQQLPEAVMIGVR